MGLGSSFSNSTNVSSVGKVRLEKDLEELRNSGSSLPSNVKLEFMHPEDISTFTISIVPRSGFYQSGVFVFKVNINDNYPIDPPKVKLVQKIYHPNIDLQGNVCLNILREEWSPALDLYRVIMGLLVLFSEPNPNDPLNKDAANLLANDLRMFQYNVRKSMEGGYIGDEKFDKII